MNTSRIVTCAVRHSKHVSPSVYTYSPSFSSNTYISTADREEDLRMWSKKHWLPDCIYGNCSTIWPFQYIYIIYKYYYMYTERITCMRKNWMIFLWIFSIYIIIYISASKVVLYLGNIYKWSTYICCYHCYTKWYMCVQIIIIPYKLIIIIFIVPAG